MKQLSDEAELRLEQVGFLTIQKDEPTTIRVFVRLVAQEAHNNVLRQVIEILEKHKDDELAYDWGQRQGAPIVVLTFDPLEYQALKKEVEKK